MTKPSPSRYCTTNWSSYNAALRKRGSLLIWVDKDMTWRAPREGRPGRPAVFSGAAIQFCLSIKVLFKLPLQQTAGMVSSLLRLAGQARKHGVQGRRQWRKVHLAMDKATSGIRAVEFTPSLNGDSPVLPDLLGQIPEVEQIDTLTADGAYDTRRCHTAIIDRQAAPIFPIRKNGRAWKEACPAARVRNETLRATRHYRRAFCKRWTGHHARSRIEAKMRCLKAFSERIAARDPERQTAEIHIRIALMNPFNALGTGEIVRVA